ncbi:MAG TPA: histidine kinase [Cytophagaceae bacterium]
MKAKWVKYHILFFIVTWIFNYVFNFRPTIPEGSVVTYFLFFVIENILLAGYFYAVLLLSPVFFNRMLYLIPVQLVFMLVGCAVLSVNPFLFYLWNGENQEFSRVYFMKMFEVAYFSFSSLGFLFLQKWDESTHQKLQLIESLSEAELTFLRSQMSPHFLLNTLNVIYALALKKSPEVYPAMAELNNIYSYAQRSQGKVSLKDEVEYIRNFINIQKRRFGSSVIVEVYFDMDKDYEIEPLLLSTFIENAFKHGISSKSPGNIRIELTAKEGILQYNVYNDDHSLKYKDATSGIGLKNLSRRLELLYPGDYSLSGFLDENVYKAQLTIRNL